jgi:DNA-binding PadR family transcriptional regulator
MSAIRVFILGSLAERGQMHGHQLRLLGERDHIHMWTDVTVGGIYGALKRLAVDGLIESVRTERAGNRPERHVYDITPAGRTTLAAMLRETLTEFSPRPDPFDLALTRLDAAAVDELPGILATRRRAIEKTLAAKQAKLTLIEQRLTVAERHAMAHQQFRLRAELAWTDSLIVALPELTHDEKSREDS